LGNSRLVRALDDVTTLHSSSTHAERRRFQVELGDGGTGVELTLTMSPSVDSWRGDRLA